MRRLLPAFLAVASAILGSGAAFAAETPTTPLAGYCQWGDEPILAALSSSLDDAASHVAESRCSAAASTDVDPHVRTEVLATSTRDPGDPLGPPDRMRLEIEVRYVATPFLDPDATAAAPAASWLSYQGVKRGMAWYSAATQKLAEESGTVYAERLAIGPTWLRYLKGAAIATVIEAGAGVLASPGNLILLPESLLNTGATLGHGASEMKDGWSAGDGRRTAEGFAEICGGVGLVASVAVPIAKGGGALLPSPRAPITLFPKGVPVVAARAPPIPSAPAMLPGVAAATARSVPVTRASAPPPFRIAPRLTLSQSALEHIVERHWGTAGTSVTDKPAGHFSPALSSARELRALVETAGERGHWVRGHSKRWLVRYDAGRATGVDRAGVSSRGIEIVVEADGTVVTAYPIP